MATLGRKSRREWVGLVQEKGVTVHGGREEDNTPLHYHLITRKAALLSLSLSLRTAEQTEQTCMVCERTRRLAGVRGGRGYFDITSWTSLLSAFLQGLVD